MRALAVPLALLALAACQPDASPEDTSDAVASEDVRTGAPISTRAEGVTITSLSATDQTCRIAFETAGGEAREADGLRSFCNATDLIGREVELSYTTFDVEGEPGADRELVSGIRPVPAAE